MRKHISLISLLLSWVISSWAGPGDTTIIQTIDHNTPVNPGWNAPREGKYLFPPDSISFSKILMYYTLKCDPGQNPACGEWDYTTHTYLKFHTGNYDSNLYYHYNFVVNGTTPDTFQFMNDVSWSYRSYFEYFNQTSPQVIIPVGDGNESINLTFNETPESRQLYLYRPEELGTAGEMTGLQVNIASGGGYLKNFTIRMKATDSTTLTPENLVDEGFITVFRRSLDLGNAGWIALPFAYPFNYDGNSSIILDISYEKSPETGPYIANADETGFPSGVMSAQQDHFLEFDGTDHIDIPIEAVTSIDSAVTISFWQYGDPQKQPQNDVLFEAYDQYNRRVLNVHLPWSDSKVYWDAGRDDEGYDRIQRTAPPEEFKGQWNHWAFTKDCTAGEMAVYLNGELWNYSLGKYKLMDSITAFRIGGSPAGTNFYDGMIDEFRVWNKSLDQQTIIDWMKRDVDGSHPYHAHLKAYYKFDEGDGLLAYEETSGEMALLSGYPQWMDHKGVNRHRNFVQQDKRLQVKFELGTYNPSTLDSLMMVDTIPQGQLMIVMHEDTLNPTQPTDTLSKWPSYYNNLVFDPNGVAIDSTFVTPDGTLVKDTMYYYGTPYELLVNYELGRYITPYGIGLDLGEGWTWVFDVTDFRPLLADSVHLTAGNFQELLDLKFYMIEGTPPRDVVNIERLWHGTYPLNDFENRVPPDTIALHPDAENWKLRIVTSGHDFDNSTNCAEFCQKTHWVDVNGNEEYTWEIIDPCGDNPLYPQGGTWIYDRAGWCPGAKVTERHMEITPFVTGDSIVLDYNCESDPYGRYIVTSYLFEYGPPNFTLDASVEEILEPNNKEVYSRFNPMCGVPEIVIRNGGADTLHSIDILYGPEGGAMQTFSWAGSLAFMDTAHVKLDPIDWAEWPGNDYRFTAMVSDPNGGQDENELNDAMTSAFSLAPEFPNQFVVRFRSNKRPFENRWEIRDANGFLVMERDEFEPQTEYLDTVLLIDGCYTFLMTDSGNDGLSFWAHGFQGSGYVQIRGLDNAMLHYFTADFGAFTQLDFTVGLAVSAQDLVREDYIHIYPNPATDRVQVALALLEPHEVDVTVFNFSGQEVARKSTFGDRGQLIEISTGHLPAGVYLVRVAAGGTVHTEKLVISD